jgi:hypothetical protein
VPEHTALSKRARARRKKGAISYEVFGKEIIRSLFTYRKDKK